MEAACPAARKEVAATARRAHAHRTCSAAHRIADPAGDTLLPND
jgi:hypothetical protein